MLYISSIVWNSVSLLLDWLTFKAEEPSVAYLTHNSWEKKRVSHEQGFNRLSWNLNSARVQILGESVAVSSTLRDNIRYTSVTSRCIICI